MFSFSSCYPRLILILYVARHVASTAEKMPDWLKQASSELLAIQGPPDWAHLVQSFQYLEEHLGFPNNKVF
jgi:hypothetical protein